MNACISRIGDFSPERFISHGLFFMLLLFSACVALKLLISSLFHNFPFALKHRATALSVRLQIPDGHLSTAWIWPRYKAERGLPVK